MKETPPPDSTRNSRWLLVGSLALLIAVAGVAYWYQRETDQERAKRLLADARTLRLKGEYAQAEELALAAIEHDPALTEAAILAARCAVAQKKFEQALDYAQKATVPESEHQIEAMLLTGEVYHKRLFRLSLAEEAYRRVLAINPGHLDANTELANLLGVCGRGPEAVPHVLKNLEFGNASDQLILISRASGGISDLPLLEKALAASPQDANVLVGLAWHAASDGRNTDATRLLKTALSHHPEHAAAYVAIGRQFLVQGLFGELVNWSHETPKSAEDFGETWFLRGRIAEHQDNSAGAIRCYWEALKRAPESKEANFRLSRLLFAEDLPALAEPFAAQIRRIDRLRTLQDQVLSNGPSEELIFDLAKAYEDAGRVWEAYGWCVLAKPYLSENSELAHLLHQFEDKTKSLPLRQTVDAMNPAIAVDLSAYPLPKFHSVINSSPVDSPMGPSAISFRDDAAQAGLVFQFFNGSKKPARRMYEVTGGGVGVLDYDLDGFLDVCFSQGCPWPPSQTDDEYKDQLFRNYAGRRFENVTHDVGFRGQGFGQGVAVGDYNSDGFSDVYIARIGANRLWENNGDGTFTDVTDSAKLSGREWTTSCLMADLNGDGHPDLYDVNYLKGENIFERVCRNADGMAVQCLPFEFDGQPDRLWLNSGDGGFMDATAESLSVVPDGKGLGIIAWDALGTDQLSLLVANDTTPNFFFTPDPQRKNEFHLLDQGLISGLAFNGQGKAEGCMGIALGDVDDNGHLDVHVTNFLAESNTLWLCESPGLYEDKTQELGLREPTLDLLGFGTQFLDADLDGRSELFVTNGHVDDLTALGKPYAMPPQLFQWDGNRFHEADPKQLGPYFQKKWLGRAAARWDWNRDGRDDLVVGHLYEDSALLTNTSPDPGRFLSLKLIGTQSARDPVGTVVRIRIGSRTSVQQVTAGDGYQCSNSREMIFGAGAAETIDEIVIDWPLGKPQRFENVSTNTHWLVVEGHPLRELP